MITFTHLVSGVDLGYIPEFLSELSPEKAAKQIDRGYRHGGGWVPFEGHVFNPLSKALSFPGDPVMFPIAVGHLRDETIYVYPSDWVLILQTDGTYEVARID